MDPAEDDLRVEREIMGLLLKAENEIWSVGELELQLQDTLAVSDALNRLRRGGLVHHHGDLVLATRAAKLCARIVEL